MTTEARLARWSSIALRFGSWFFLRCALFPPLVPAVFTLFAAYIPLFWSSFFTEPDYKVVLDEVDVIVDDVVIKVSDDGAVDADGENDALIEKVDIQETVVLEEKPWFSLESLLTGAPNPRSLVLSLLTFLINAACVAMVADRLFTEHQYTETDLSFARLGYVSDTEAKLLIREPNQSRMPVTVEIRIKDAKAPFDSPIWQTAGSARFTTNETDYTTVITLPLRHDSQRVYEYRTSNNHTGEFTSAPRPGTMPEKYGGKFTFLSTSCHVSRLPYNPMDHPLAINGMRHLAAVLPTLGAQFMLFLGDFIYVDVPWRWGTQKTDYRQKYRQIYASPDWPTVSQNLSWIHVLDDHEISNDWDKNSTGLYAAAVDPWHHYHTAANPPPARRSLQSALNPSALSPSPSSSSSSSLSPSPGRVTWFEFTQGPATFFLLDTRSYRSSNTILPATHPNKTMLGPDQLSDLLAFLARPLPRGVHWKFIASSVPFTRNWRVNNKDTWGGFLAERQVVLEAMWDSGARGQGVVILSGDRHEFAATKFVPPVAVRDRWPEEVAPVEFCASPLSQFFGPVPTYWQRDEIDVKLEYIHNGNSKFGALTIENIAPSIGGPAKSNLHYRLFVNGKQRWDTNITAPQRLEGLTTAHGSATGFWSRLIGSRD